MRLLWSYNETITTVAVTALTISVAYAFAFKPPNKVKMIATATSTSKSLPVLPKGTKESSFVNSRSQKIHTIQLEPTADDNNKRAVATVFFLHGLGDHCGRPGYCGFYERLAAQNCQVFALDHHGHGQSEGSPRVYCERFDDYVDDYLEFIGKNWKDDDPPLFLVGQSLGGLMAIFLADRLGDKVKGVILNSPACGVNMDLEKKIQLFLAPVIDRVCPKAKLVDAVRSEDLTRNQREVTAYLADPLIGKGKLSAHTGIQISYTFDRLRKEVQSRLACPLLINHGTEDKVTEIGASEAFFHSIATEPSRKLFVRLPGFFHEICHEIEVEKEPVLEFMADFVTSGGTQFPGGVVGDNRVMDFELPKE